MKISSPYSMEKLQNKVIIRISKSNYITFPDGYLLKHSITLTDFNKDCKINNWELPPFSIIRIQRLVANKELNDINAIDEITQELILSLETTDTKLEVQTEMLFESEYENIDTIYNISLQQIIDAALILSGGINTESNRNKYDYYFKLLTNVLIL